MFDTKREVAISCEVCPWPPRPVGAAVGAAELLRRLRVEAEEEQPHQSMAVAVEALHQLMVQSVVEAAQQRQRPMLTEEAPMKMMM